MVTARSCEFMESIHTCVRAKVRLVSLQAIDGNGRRRLSIAKAKVENQWCTTVSTFLNSASGKSEEAGSLHVQIGPVTDVAEVAGKTRQGIDHREDGEPSVAAGDVEGFLGE